MSSTSEQHAVGLGRAGRLSQVGPCLSLGVALLAGCGGSFTAGTHALQVEPGMRAVRTGEQLHLAATATASGEPAQVRWRIVSTDNAPALGRGSISDDGVYTPPGMLSRDVVSVTIAAVPLGGDSAGPPVTTTLSIVPGFVQPLQPENATLAPGSSLQVRAQLAEVGRGSVSWSLVNASGLAAAVTSDPASLGTLSGQQCESSLRQFTTCTVTYTAPQGVAPAALIWLIATTHSASGLPGASIRARLAPGAINSNPALHQFEQASPAALGSSGGSDNDFDTYKGSGGTRYVADCCGGTLGALIEDRFGTPYILSNNHVLATSDQGRPGDTIEQPGLIDDGCVPLSEAGTRMQAVGTLRYSVPLSDRGSNVDAAMASVHPGAIDASGAILELGSALPDRSLHSASPVAGMGEALDAERLGGLSVVKSGRTTGLTCSTVDAVDLRVKVDYYKDCAETQPYLSKIFTGQIGIGGEAFADSGDSGALILDASNAQPVGLLYATGSSANADSSGLTLANPIGDVLHELSTQAGLSLKVRGTATPHRVTCLNYDPPFTRAALSTLPLVERTRVAAAVEAAATLRSARVLATAGGTSADDPGAGAVLVYVDRTQPSVPIPATIDGVRTVIVPSDLETILRSPAAWPAAGVRPGIRFSAPVLSAAQAVAEQLAPAMMQTPAIFGVGVTQSLDDPDEPALLVLLDSDGSRLEAGRVLAHVARRSSEAGEATAGLPATLGGMRVRYMTLHRLRVTQSKYVARGAASGCAPHSLTAKPGWSLQNSLLPPFSD